MKIAPIYAGLMSAVLLLTSPVFAADTAVTPGRYGTAAREVMEYVQQKFYDQQTGLYMKSSTQRVPDYMWANGVMFSALVGATRHEPQTYRPIMDKFFTAMDGYWDAQAPIPGYEADRIDGNGNDKYYDDNAWMVITFLEAYQLTGDPRYLDRATQTLHFVRSGWDEQLGGGIWWHQGHKDGTKNTCSNAPAAVGCLGLARLVPHDQAVELGDAAKKIVSWTTDHLQTPDGLFEDRQVVATGEIKRGKLTYNSALMLRANLGLFRRDFDAHYLVEAKRIARAAGGLISPLTGVYRDGVKYAQFMVEADLELYRLTKDDYLMARARKNADACYRNWQQHPPSDLISNAAIARILWLMADTETQAGRVFWKQADAKPEAAKGLAGQ